MKYLAILILFTGLILACRGGANKNNDHDDDNKNEKYDQVSPPQTDSITEDTGRIRE